MFKKPAETVWPPSLKWPKPRAQILPTFVLASAAVLSQGSAALKPYLIELLLPRLHFKFSVKP